VKVRDGDGDGARIKIRQRGVLDVITVQVAYRDIKLRNRRIWRECERSQAQEYF